MVMFRMELLEFWSLGVLHEALLSLGYLQLETRKSNRWDYLRHEGIKDVHVAVERVYVGDVPYLRILPHYHLRGAEITTFWTRRPQRHLELRYGDGVDRRMQEITVRYNELMEKEVQRAYHVRRR